MKRILSLILIALMMFSVLFITVSCSEEQEQPKPIVNYQVAFDLQDGSAVEPQTVKSGTVVKAPTPDPTRENYVFFGWFSDAGCTTEYKFTSPITKDTTIYAKWVSEADVRRVTFNLNYEGAAAGDVSVVESGKTVAKPKKDPTQTGFYFSEWCSDAECKTAYDFTTAVTENITLYAKWVDQTTYEHSDPILPAGSVALNKNSFSIPTNWSSDAKGWTAANGYTDLPAVIYSFSGERTNVTNVSEDLKTAIAAAMADPNFFAATPTNVIFLFSDGWGVTGVNMSREYKGELIMDSLPYATESKTDSYKQYSFTTPSINSDYTSHTTTDSCAGGTQVLAGYKTRYGYISLDVDGNHVMNLTEAAMAKGWKTAVVTNDNIIDATPADAMVHDTNRYHTDVLTYKAFRYALVENGLDLLMGWDWYMSDYIKNASIADKLKAGEIGGIEDAISRQSLSSKEAKADHSDPVKYFKNLSADEQYKVAPFSVYYTLYEYQDLATRLNSFMDWPTDSSKREDYLNWLQNKGAYANSGLTAAIAEVGTALGDKPADKVKQFSSFSALVKNTDFDKPILGSWSNSGNDYESNSPNRGYCLHGSVGKSYPSWPEMVAYTIYQMDKEANDANTGFFCIIENTCTDGWGHSGNKPVKIAGMLNEVQCFDEGVAIAVKYVLEHPDTLLVVSADHETGAYSLATGWETDYSQLRAPSGSHSSQRVPLYAFGAGAQNFSAEAIKAKYGEFDRAGVEEDGHVHEGWIAGALMGELITGEAFGLTGKTTYNGQAFATTATPRYGAPLWEPADPVWTPAAE